MNKDEILAKSRKENKYCDPYEQETNRQAGLWASLAMVVVLLILQAAHLALRGETSSSLWAIMTAYWAADNAVKAIRCKKVWNGVFAVLFGACCVAFIVLAIRDLKG